MFHARILKNTFSERYAFWEKKFANFIQISSTVFHNNEQKRDLQTILDRFYMTFARLNPTFWFFFSKSRTCLLSYRPIARRHIRAKFHAYWPFNSWDLLPKEKRKKHTIGKPERRQVIKDYKLVCAHFWQLIIKFVILGSVSGPRCLGHIKKFH